MAHILVVEDEPSIMNLLVQILKTFGYEATAVASCSEALKTLESKSFDLIISDYRLGNERGDFLYHWVRSNLPKTPFMFCTGSAEEVPIKNVPLVPKPFPVKQLVDAVEDILQTQALALP